MTSINNSKTALLVHTCDRYEFLYKGFENFFSRYWDFHIPCNCYFATEEKHAAVKGFQNILSGKGQWTDRLVSLLNKIPEEYVLYMQEDMWLDKAVNESFFRQLFDVAISNKWMQVKLHSSEVYQTAATDIFIEGFNIAKVDNKISDYLMSHQATLWNKQFLLRQLFKGEHPWRNERKGTKRLKELNPEIYHADYFSENGKPEININDRPVMRSGYKTVSLNGTLNSGVMPFISMLQKGSEDEKQYAEQLLYHYENSLTHDGKARPRKEDVFMKIKNAVKKALKV